MFLIDFWILLAHLWNKFLTKKIFKKILGINNYTYCIQFLQYSLLSENNRNPTLLHIIKDFNEIPKEIFVKEKEKSHVPRKPLESTWEKKSAAIYLR